MLPAYGKFIGVAEIVFRRTPKFGTRQVEYLELSQLLIVIDEIVDVLCFGRIVIGGNRDDSVLCLGVLFDQASAGEAEGVGNIADFDALERLQVEKIEGEFQSSEG